MMGALSNIDRDGFASAAFHSFPDTLKWDAYSGDYGMNFFGHAMNAATYIIDSPDFGWQAFGGNVVQNSERHVVVVPLDAMRRRIYIAPFGLWLTLDAGTFSEIRVSKRSHSILVMLSHPKMGGESARLRIEQPAKIDGVGKFYPTDPLKVERDAYVIKLNRNANQVTLVEKK
jgi:hypothetical protein